MAAQEPKTMREAFRFRRAVWPARARALWLVVRPLCTVAALAGCMVAWLDGASLLPAIGAFVLVAVVRPTRRPWISVILAGIVYFVSPVAAIAVTLRALVGGLAMMLAGGSWAHGMAVVRRGREAMFGLPQPPEARERLATALRTETESGEGVERASEYWLATWATADLAALRRVTAELLRGLLLWDWGFPTGPNFEIRLMRMAVSETVITFTCRVLGVATTVAIVLLTDLMAPATVFGWALPSWVSLIPAALTTWSLSRRSAKAAPPIVGPILLVTLCFVLYGWLTVRLLGCAAVVVLPTRFCYSLLTNRLLGRQEVQPRLPLFVGGLAVRDIWNSARIALAEKRYRVANRLWGQLADDEAQLSSVNAYAYAAQTHLSLATGNIQHAVENAGRALQHAGGSARVRQDVAGTAARAFLAAGDSGAAKDYLDLAEKSRRQRRNPMFAAAKAQIIAADRTADVDQALTALGRSSGGLLRSGNLLDLIEAEVAVVALLIDRAPLSTLEDRILQLLSFDLDDLENVDSSQREQANIALARARLLLGRIQLRDKKSGTAVQNFQHAITSLTGPQNGFDQALGRILLGVARNRLNRVNGLPELTLGTRTLEVLRGQMAMGRYRNQLIQRHAEVYQDALDALARLQVVDRAGSLLGFELAESLRRNALARALRERNRDFSEKVRRIRENIDEIEASGHAVERAADLAGHQKRLADELSADFANAYLPEPVDMDRLRSTTNEVHCLLFRMTRIDATRARGHVVWLPPQGDAVIHRIDVSNPSQLSVLSTKDGAARNLVMVAAESDAEVERWQKLTANLLPPELRAVLLRATEPLNLVIVPDGELSAFPWAALRLEDERVLLETAVIQVVPALSILDRRAPRRGQGSMLMYLDPQLPTDSELTTLSDLGCADVTSRDALVSALDQQAWSGMYVAAHGDGVGLAQQIRFHDGSSLSAATALTMRWPPWIVFASCFVGEIRADAGEDPLGLPVSCLLGGADAFIGGIIEMDDVAAGDLCPRIAQGILRGAHPAVALRDAQLSYVRSRRVVPGPAKWAGFVCVSRTAAPASGKV